MDLDNPIRSKFLMSILRWVDSEAGLDAMPSNTGRRVEWLRIAPFVVLHGMCLGVIWVGWSWVAVATASVLYFVRMFAITGFYHRYFSHKTYRTNRFWQFIFAVLGNSAVQRGPLWWASHHRHHHRFADTDEDPHSPNRQGFWWSHIGWLTSERHFPTRAQYVKDWACFPELVWLNRFDTLMPVLLATGLYAFGAVLKAYAPQLGTSGPQMLIWGFFISSTVFFHGTVTINSLDHMIGSRRYDTPDTSRNNWVLALITLGEGWHNNHHHYAISARQGFFWWEIDVTFYLLKLMSWLGIVCDRRPVPEHVRNPGPASGGEPRTNI
jgi:stearoyl-CoA desaturase (delta-9 desaturase)